MADDANVSGENEVLGTFVLAVRGIKLSDGRFTTDVQTKNENLPLDTILMHVRAWLHDKEESYYELFASRFGTSM